MLTCHETKTKHGTRMRNKPIQLAPHQHLPMAMNHDKGMVLHGIKVHVHEDMDFLSREPLFAEDELRLDRGDDTASEASAIDLFVDRYPRSAEYSQKICFVQNEEKFFITAREVCNCSTVVDTLLSSGALLLDDSIESYMIQINDDDCDVEGTKMFVTLCRYSGRALNTSMQLSCWKALPLIKKFECHGLQQLVYAFIVASPSISSMAMYDRFYANTIWDVRSMAYLLTELRKHRDMPCPSMEQLSKPTLLKLCHHIVVVNEYAQEASESEINKAKLRIEELELELQQQREHIRIKVFEARTEVEKTVATAKTRAMERFLEAKRRQSEASKRAQDCENKALVALEASERAAEELKRHEEALRHLSERAKEMKVAAAKTSALAEEARIEEQSQAKRFALASLTSIELQRRLLEDSPQPLFTNQTVQEISFVGVEASKHMTTGDSKDVLLQDQHLANINETKLSHVTHKVVPSLDDSVDVSLAFSEAFKPDIVCTPITVNDSPEYSIRECRSIESRSSGSCTEVGDVENNTNFSL